MKRSIAALLALGLLCVFCGTSQAALTMATLGSAGVDPELPIVYNYTDLGDPGDSVDDTHELIVNGSDIWGTDDHGGFFYSGETTEANFILTARVVSFENPSNVWGKAGVMVRDTLDTGSMHAFMASTDTTHRRAFQRRPSTDGSSSSDHNGTTNLVEWVRLERFGDQFTAYYIDPDDPGDWIQQGPTVTIPMVDSVYVGLAATSHTNDGTPESLGTALLDNYQLEIIPELIWDKATATAGDWTDANWLTPPPSYPDAGTITIVENDGGASTGFLLVNVTGDEAAKRLLLREPGGDPDTGNYVWLRRTTGWNGGAPDDTFGSLTVSHSIDGSQANNFLVMDQGTSLNTGTADSVISGMMFFGSQYHPGPNGMPEEGGGDDVTIPIEDVVVTTPGDLRVLHRMDDVSFPGDPSRRFVKRGAGTLSFDSTTGVMLTPNTTFRIEEGAISLRGFDPLGGSTAPIELAGGDLEITAPVIPGAGPADALAWLSFNDPADLGKDSGPNGNPGTVTGATWTTDTVFGGALEFDGDDDYVNFGQPSPLDSIDTASTMTVAMWFKREFDDAGNANRTNHQINNVLLAHSSGDTNDTFELGTQTDGIELYIDSQNGGNDQIRNPGEQPPGGIANDVWHHIAVTYDSSQSSKEVSFYFNGELIREWGAPDGNLDSRSTAADTPWTIGIARPDGELWGDFYGKIDEFYLYDRALTLEEIVPMVGERPLDLSANTLVVAADSGLNLIATGTVPFGGLTLQQGTLTVQPAIGLDLVQFPATDIPKYTGAPGEPPDDRTVGVNTQVPVDLGVITGNDSTATLVKEGPEDLVLNPGNTGLDSATIAPMGGRTIAVIGPGADPLGAATVEFLPPDPISLTAHYAFEDAGNLGEDSSAGGYDGAAVGDPTQVADGQAGSAWAVELDGD
ncbi:MAG: LamG domain-containing protein, partial [Planctomycetota bacterium]